MIFNDISLYIFLTIILVTALITDISSRKIPNMLTFPSMIIAIGYHSLLNGFNGFLFSIEGIGLGMAAFILIYMVGGMGAGDVKLMGAVGGFLGPEGIFAACIFTALFGGLYSLLVLAFNGCLIETMKRYGTILKTFFLTKKIVLVPSSLEVKKLKICYGIAIAFGTTLSILWENFI